jgi:hypothetical protein
MSRLLSKHVSRTRKLFASVLASEVATQQPVGPERTALECALQGLEPIEQRLLLAAEIPGWPDRDSGAPTQPFRSLLTATASALVEVGDSDVGDGDWPEVWGQHETDVGLAAAPVVAPKAVAAAGPAPLGGLAQHVHGLPRRPFVHAELRLLWKAAAHDLIRTRMEQDQRHEALARSFGAVNEIALLAQAEDRREAALKPAIIDLCSPLDSDVEDGEGEGEGAVSVVGRSAASIAALEASVFGDEAAAASGITGGSKKSRKRVGVTAAAAVPASVAIDSSDARSSVGRTKSQLPSLPVRVSARALVPSAAPRKADSDGDGLLPVFAATAAKVKSKPHVSGAAAAAAALLARPARGVHTMEALPRSSTVVVFPLSRMEGRTSLLRDLRPTAIVVFDPDPAFTREIEARALLYRTLVALVATMLPAYFLLFAGLQVNPCRGLAAAGVLYSGTGIS